MPERRRANPVPVQINNNDRPWADLGSFASVSSLSYEDLITYRKNLESISSTPPKDSKKKVGVADRAFFHAIKTHIPEATLIENYSDVSKYDLIVFTGGEDVDPNLYGEENIYSHGVNTNRDRWEQKIFYEACNRKKKILGVCRGHQIINVFLGGTLFQDFVAQNSGFSYHPGNHKVFETKGIIDKYFNNEYIISCHHQAVNKLGEGLFPTSIYNGVIESMESRDGRIVTTQFHPEFDDKDNPAVNKFFKFIVEEW